jgi:histidinol-phosphate aminotransferase
MYEVSADINDVEVRRAPLTAGFALDRAAIARVSDERSKLLFICSPNNPTGNAFEPAEIAAIASDFGGIVVVDEAYADFSGRGSVLGLLGELPNVVVLRTFSKAWGLAGLRVGMAFASPEIVTLLNNVKPPYNVSEIAQKAVIEAIDAAPDTGFEVAAIIGERSRLIENLGRLGFVERIFPTDANFVLVRMSGADAVYRYLLGRRIVVRNRSNVELCGDCLRITVGTPAENDALLAALEDFGEERI